VVLHPVPAQVFHTRTLKPFALYCLAGGAIYFVLMLITG
jgi:hypothetical protein